MKILLSGDHREAAALLRLLLANNDHEITHCADGARAIFKLLRNGYDWAIINGRDVGGGSMDISRLIRAMGPELSEQNAEGASSPCHHHGQGAGGRAPCGVEWTKDGVLQLHCGLHERLKPDARLRHDDQDSPGDIIFQYHAPCGKPRGHHG